VTRRKSWAVALNATTGLITVEDARLSMSALWTPAGQITSRSGLVPAASEPGRVTATSPTPNGFVHVAPFRAVLQSNRGGGTYVMCSDAVEDINILSTPADPSNPRIDLIVFQQNDTYFGVDANSDMLVRHIVGTAAAVPVDPAVSGSTDYIIRARVTVPAGATDIEQGDIANVALPWTVATGGILPIRNQTERDAITAASAAYEGMAIYRIDRDWEEQYDGTAFRVQGVAICSSIADRDSAITHPRSGQLAVTTDTDQLWHYDAATSQWRYAVPGTVIGGKRRTTTASATSGTTELQVLDTGSLPLIGNSLFEVRVSLNWDVNVAGDNFITRIRDTNVSGTVRTQPTAPGLPLAGVPTGYTFSAPYPTSTAENKTFVGTIARIGGSGSATVTPGSFIEVIYKGAATMFGTL
jgi:hypothetical protein